MVINGHDAVRVVGRASTGALRTRLIAGLVFVIGMFVLIVAASLHAEPVGLGTHEQLGLPQCGLLLSIGLPCPTCGMTTSFSYAADGSLLTAWRTQPAGATLAILTAMIVLVSGWSMCTGASLAPLGRLLARPAVFWIGGVLILGAWLYKIAAVQSLL